jgi:hypothetical protein
VIFLRNVQGKVDYDFEMIRCAVIFALNISTDVLDMLGSHDRDNLLASTSYGGSKHVHRVPLSTTQKLVGDVGR